LVNFGETKKGKKEQKAKNSKNSKKDQKIGIDDCTQYYEMT